MMALVRAAVALFLTLAIVGYPAQAQEQTPENAQRFLAITLRNAVLHDRRLNAVPYYATNQSIASLRSRGQRFDLISYGSTGICDAAIQLNGDDVIYRHSTDADPATAHLRTGPVTSSVRTAGVRNLVLDWRAVSSARAEGNIVIIGTSQTPAPDYWADTATDNRTIEIVLPDPDLATRVAFAMQVIRIRCDPATDTGF